MLYTHIVAHIHIHTRQFVNLASKVSCVQLYWLSFQAKPTIRKLLFHWGAEPSLNFKLGTQGFTVLSAFLEGAILTKNDITPLWRSKAGLVGDALEGRSNQWWNQSFGFCFPCWLTRQVCTKLALEALTGKAGCTEETSAWADAGVNYSRMFMNNWIVLSMHFFLNLRLQNRSSTENGLEMQSHHLTLLLQVRIVPHWWWFSEGLKEVAQLRWLLSGEVRLQRLQTGVNDQ